MPYEIVRPHVEKKKRGRGRPAAGFDVNSPKGDQELPPGLYNFTGTTKEEKLHQLYDGPLEDGQGWFNCQRCFLGQLRCSEGRGEDTVFFTGNPNADILIVGEAPGEQEENEKQAFIGPAGQTLNLILAKTSDDPAICQLYDRYVSLDYREKTADVTVEFHDTVRKWRDQEFAITNVVACRPPDNRAPTLPEMKACWERLWNIIYIVDPMLIVACGNTALSGVTRKLAAQITKTRGQIFDAVHHGKVGTVTYPIMPVFHPSYLSRVADWNVADGAYARTVKDWKKALHIVDLLRHHHYGTPIPRRG